MIDIFYNSFILDLKYILCEFIPVRIITFIISICKPIFKFDKLSGNRLYCPIYIRIK